MSPIQHDQLEKAVAVLGTEGISDDEIEAGVAALVGDPMAARRLIDWIPEAFGIVLISHIAKVVLPTTFSAKSSNGEWVKFPFEAEPIFQAALGLATNLYHSGPRSTFGNVAMRSSMVDVVNRALNAGQSIEGATLSGPALIGIPAEVYEKRQVPFWRRLFRGQG